METIIWCQVTKCKQLFDTKWVTKKKCGSQRVNFNLKLKFNVSNSCIEFVDHIIIIGPKLNTKWFADNKKSSNMFMQIPIHIEKRKQAKQSWISQKIDNSILRQRQNSEYFTRLRQQNLLFTNGFAEWAMVEVESALATLSKWSEERSKCPEDMGPFVC